MLKNPRLSTYVSLPSGRLWNAGSVVHNHGESDEGLVDGISYDHPQSTAPTTTTRF